MRISREKSGIRKVTLSSWVLCYLRWVKIPHLNKKCKRRTRTKGKSPPHERVVAFSTGISDLFPLLCEVPPPTPFMYETSIVNFFPNLHTHKKSREHCHTEPQTRGEAKKWGTRVFGGNQPWGPPSVILAGCPAQPWCRWQSAQSGICPQASLKNALFSAGPNALFDHGQNIYSCGAASVVELHGLLLRAGSGDSVTRAQTLLLQGDDRCPLGIKSND